MLGVNIFVVDEELFWQVALAEVESHAGYTLRDAVWRWQAAQVPARFQGAVADHSEPFLFLSGRTAMKPGVTIIPRNTRARIKS